MQIRMAEELSHWRLLSDSAHVWDIFPAAQSIADVSPWRLSEQGPGDGMAAMGTLARGCT